MIPEETINQIRETLDIGQVIGEYVRLKKRGRNFEGLCPFHTEKTPSFKVNSDKQIYHCFGCGKGGNLFTFLMEHERMSFVEAVKHLAPKANVTIREAKSDFRREQIERISYAQTVALEYFKKQLKLPKYSVVRDKYLKESRRITEESIETFGLGMASEEWDDFLKHATAKGLSKDDLVKAGLLIYNEDKNSYYDRFRQRLMIPIFDLSSRPIAFGGRTLEKGNNVKYINSPETSLYYKSNVLYGLNFARDEIRDKRFVYVVEGYFDVISLWQVGIRNVVASSGTAFTSQQARLIARFADTAYLFFDADSAGQKAAVKSVDSLYDAGLDVKVVVPPDGEDPDSVAREFGAEGIEMLRAAALDFLKYRTSGLDVAKSGIIDREKLIKELATLGARIHDATRRSLFLQEAADLLRVDRTLMDTARQRPLRQSHEQMPVGPQLTKVSRIELEFLSLFVCNPGSIDAVIENISAEDFDSKQLSRLYQALITQYEMDGVTNINRLLEHMQDDESISLLSELALIDWPAETIDQEMSDRTRDFIERKQRKIRSRLQKELAVAESEGNTDKANMILEQMKQFGL